MCWNLKHNEPRGVFLVSFILTPKNQHRYKQIFKSFCSRNDKMMPYKLFFFFLHAGTKKLFSPCVHTTAAEKQTVHAWRRTWPYILIWHWLMQGLTCKTGLSIRWSRPRGTTCTTERTFWNIFAPVQCPGVFSSPSKAPKWTAKQYWTICLMTDVSFKG